MDILIKNNKWEVAMIFKNIINHKKVFKLKKGFSLIELLVSIALLLMVATFININIKGYLNIMNDIDYILCDEAIVSFINNGKQYCREKEVMGRIYFPSNNDSLILYSGSKRIDIYNLPKNFKFTKVGVRNREININSKGITGDAGTLNYIDRKGKIHEITISVGTAHVQIK